jgi:hypothetical protein
MNNFHPIRFVAGADRGPARDGRMEKMILHLEIILFTMHIHAEEKRRENRSSNHE